MVRAEGWRAFVLVGIVLALNAGVTACSAQKPGSKVDGSQSENKLALDRSLALSAQSSRSPVRIDYLRHLSDIQNPELYVYKERRRLYVVDSNVVVRDYPIGLGKQPWGDKERDGDGRTPEGAFLVFSKGSLPDHGMGLRMKSTALPSPERASSLHFQTLAAAGAHRRSMKESAWKGQFFIHGGGAQADWTDGSVALYPSDMDELSQIVSLGTSVTVRP